MTRPFAALVAMLLLAGTPVAGQSISQAAAAPLQNVQTAAPEVHPTPAHTGWASLAKDTGRDFIAFPKRKSTWVLAGGRRGRRAPRAPGR